MPKASEPKEPHRSFTIRISEELYAEIGDLARLDGMHMDGKVNQLIRLGMDKHTSLDAAVARLLKKEVIDG